MRRLLLLSNSTNHGAGYLDHAIDAVVSFLGPARRILFVPFALRDWTAYTAKAGQRLARAGLEVKGATADGQALAAVEEAEAVFVGGGNTFRLLDRLQRSGLLEALRHRAAAGVPYIWASAGTNIAAPTIKTTNDMPIVQPVSFSALGLVPFQINPHYIDADPSSRHMGETREERLREFLEENAMPVLGLREGAWLRVEGDHARLEGANGARLFRRGADPEEVAPGAELDQLLKAGPVDRLAG
jgi:dipeptidase E